MTAPAVELQKAIFEAVNDDPDLSAALGDARLFDRAPENVAFPHMTVGRTSVYDWATGTENNAEQLLTLHVWSKSEASKETTDIMDLVSARLRDAALSLGDHRRAHLKLEFAEARYDEDLSAHHGLLRFRAVIEEGG
ncbi:DUF3168 domain-containing protein [Mesorhizobium sp. M0909]|uniref:DUF3168 domain-containing protein n=1 Tax=unclassified Mesorhizobium TaxID=325217 RepID=UPI00333B0067